MTVLEQRAFDPAVALRQAIPDNESFINVMQDIRELNDLIVNSVAGGADFTLRLEIRGDCGQILHSRVTSDSFRRPHGVEKRIEARKKSRGE